MSEAPPFTVERAGIRLAGESLGEGPPVVLLHGLTASRRYVVHGSTALAREGFRQLMFDARGHGGSDPAPENGGYTYDEMAADLDAVLAGQSAARPVVVGHSMGSHTALVNALADSERVAGLVVAGPVHLDSYDEEALERWDRLAGALENGGIDGFLAEIEKGLDPGWRETVLRFTRRRMQEHRHLDALARALREVPRSKPFETLSELELLDVPALVVASHDVADPRHPYAVAQAYAERLPRARLISEAEGESPLAWQGGRLAREIAAFCREPAVAERHATPA